jgi:hypothetical protein
VAPKLGHMTHELGLGHHVALKLNLSSNIIYVALRLNLDLGRMALKLGLD